MTAVNIELKQKADLPSSQDNDTTAADNISSISSFLETSIESLCGDKVCASISEKANSMFFIPNFYDIVQPLVENEAREEEKVQEVVAESRVVPKEGNNDNEQQEKSTKMIHTDPDPTCAPVEETTANGGFPEAVTAIEEVPKTTPAKEEVPVPIPVADEAVGTVPPPEDIPAVGEVPKTTQTVEEVPVSVPVADEATEAISVNVLVDKEALPVAPERDVLMPDSTEDKMPIPETAEEAPATTTEEILVNKTEEGSASDPEHDPITPPIPMKENAIEETKVDVTVVEEASTPPTVKEATVPGVAIEKTPVAVPAAEDAAISFTVTEKTPSATLATEKVPVPLPSAE